MKSMIFALMLAGGGVASATADAATQQEQAACRSDAMKYCSEAIGKPSQMSACLEKNKQSLSDACRQVVEAHGG